MRNTVLRHTVHGVYRYVLPLATAVRLDRPSTPAPVTMYAPCTHHAHVYTMHARCSYHALPAFRPSLPAHSPANLLTYSLPSLAAHLGRPSARLEVRSKGPPPRLWPSPTEQGGGDGDEAERRGGGGGECQGWSFPVEGGL